MSFQLILTPTSRTFTINWLISFSDFSTVNYGILFKQFPRTSLQLNPKWRFTSKLGEFSIMFVVWDFDFTSSIFTSFLQKLFFQPLSPIELRMEACSRRIWHEIEMVYKWDSYSDWRFAVKSIYNLHHHNKVHISLRYPLHHIGSKCLSLFFPAIYRTTDLWTI